MIATLITSIVIGTTAAPAPLDSSLLYGKWESDDFGYSKLDFDKKGYYVEYQDDFNPKTKRRTYSADAEGQYILIVRDLTLRQSKRALTHYKSDGTPLRTLKFGRHDRVLSIAFRDKDEMIVIDVDGTKRIFVRTERLAPGY